MKKSDFNYSPWIYLLALFGLIAGEVACVVYFIKTPDKGFRLALISIGIIVFIAIIATAMVFTDSLKKKVKQQERSDREDDRFHNCGHH